MRLAPLLVILTLVSAIDVVSLFSDLFTTSTRTALPIPTGPRNHNIAVGQTSNQFTPQVLKNIPANSSLTFYFYPSNYSIIQSSFAAPCQPLGSNTSAVLPLFNPAAQPQPVLTPIFSGFHATPNSSVIALTKFVVNISDTIPIWIYAVDGEESDVAKKCREGMSMVVNPDGSIKAYRRAAVGAGSGGVPGQIFGGAVMQIPEKSRVRWMERHPTGGVRNGTDEEYVRVFTSGAGKELGGRSVSAVVWGWTGLIALLL